MKRQFVQMTSTGAKAYYQAQKAERKAAAEWYRDNPEMLLTGVAAKFKLPMSSMRKALAENGIETDRSRQYGREQHRLLCTACGERVHHVCKDQSRVVERGGKPAKRGEYIDPRWIHPITGKRIPWSAEAEAYLEGSRPYEPDLIDPATGLQRPLRPEDNYLPGDTPEMKELAVLGLDGLMERGRRELGIK